MRNETALMILGMAGVTFLTRFSCLYLFRHVRLPDTLTRSFRFIPIGILTAMIIPGLLMPGGELLIHWQNHYLLAGIVSALAAKRWNNMFASLGAGLACILLLKLM